MLKAVKIILFTWHVEKRQNIDPKRSLVKFLRHSITPRDQVQQKKHIIHIESRIDLREDI
jgi:hypothetical protein